MNIERMERLYQSLVDAAEHDGVTKIRRRKIEFDMADYFCGAAACIAGIAALHAGMKVRELVESFGSEIFNAAAEYLGLSDRQAFGLFMAETDNKMSVSLHDITATDAALTVRKLIDTGKVDWSHVNERLDAEASA